MLLWQELYSITEVKKKLHFKVVLVWNLFFNKKNTGKYELLPTTGREHLKI